MFKKFAMTLVMIGFAANAFAAAAKVEKSEKRSEDKAETAKVEGQSKETKNKNYTLQIKAEAASLEEEAKNDPSCDAQCKASFSNLNTVVNKKEELGLAGSIAPERAVHDAKRARKSGKTLSEAIKESKVDEKKLEECVAGR